MTQIPALLVTGLALLAADMQDNHATVGWGIVIFAIGVLVGIVCVLAADWRIRRRDKRAQNGPGSTRAR